MDTDKIREIILKVNGKAAEENLKSLMDSVSKAKAELKQLNESAWTEADKEKNMKRFRELRKEIDANEKKIRRYGSTADEVKRVMDSLSGATIKELKQNLIALEKALNSGTVERNSKEWQELTSAIRSTRAEMEKVRAETKKTEDAVSSATDNGGNFIQQLGKNWVGVTTIATEAVWAYSKISSMVDGYIDAYARMDAAIREVGKYTGLTDAELKALNEDLKKIDTATPREQLNALAADAGRLGIQSREDILAFVEAADIINVALGEDLGEGAVKNIGKLAQMFGDDKEMGLKQAMLSTASTINELAQSSSASEGYIVDFTSRMAGMGKTVGMTQAQIMGLAAVMDQNMLGAEMSATALSRTLQVLLNNTEQAARVAGVSTAEFSKLLRDDANEALLLFAEGLQKLGDAEQQAAALKALDMTGQGISSTLQTLAQNAATVRTTQEQATEAFRQGNSVSQEFAKQQEKVEYKLQQAKNRASEAAVTLGEALYPAYIKVLNGASGLMDFLKSTIGFFTTYHRLFLTTIAIIAAYTIQLKLAAAGLTIATAAQKGLNFVVATGKSIFALIKAPIYAVQIGYYSLRGATDKATAAQLRFNSAIRKNPIGLIVSLIALAISFIWDYVEATNAAAEGQERMNTAQDDALDIQKQASQEIQQQQTRIKTLTDIIHDNTQKLDVRRRAIEDLKRIVPGYNAMIDNEGRIIRENTKALEDYNEKLILNATMRAQEAKMTELTGDKIDIEEQLRIARLNKTSHDRNLKTFENDENKMKVINDFKNRVNGLSILNGDILDYAVFLLRNKALIEEYGTLEENAKKAGTWVNNLERELANRTKRINNLADETRTTAETMIDEFGTTGTGTGGTGTGGGTGTYTSTSDSERQKRIRAEEARLADEQRQAEIQAVAAFAADRNMTYLEYLTRMLDIDNDFLRQRRALYQEGDSEITSIDKQLADNQKKLGAQRSADSIQQVEYERDACLHLLETRRVRELMDDEQYNAERSAIEEEAALRRIEVLEAEGADAKQIDDARQAYDDLRRKNQEDKELAHLRRVADFKKEYLKADDAAKRKYEENFAKALLDAQEITEEEYRKILQLINEKYANGGTKSEALDLGSPNDGLSGAFVNLGKGMMDLRAKLKDGKADWRDYAQVAVASLATVSSMMQSASQLMQANMQAEQARVTERYDAEIEKAGENTTRGRKLEEQKQKELAKIKTKYAKKQMVMQIAMAIADTAANAIKAYGAMAEIPVVGPALGIAAAAAATAAGMIQIAVIKKQQEAQAAGYYEGGFTGGKNYRRMAGIVHQGEFVASHGAVENPALLPILRLIDSAQRAGTVASLTAEDVSRTIAAPVITAGAARSTARSTAATAENGSTAPAIVVSENPDTATTLRRLTDAIESGIHASVSIDGQDGFDRQWTRYQQMKSRR